MRAVPLALACLLVGLLSAASPAHADGKAAATAPRLSVKKMTSTRCDTDGGPVRCELAVKFLAEAFVWGSAQELETRPLECPGDRPGSHTLTVVYEYNEGDFEVTDPERQVARLPACVRDVFLPRARTHLKALWDKVHELDGRIDVRAYYKLTVVVK